MKVVVGAGSCGYAAGAAKILDVLQQVEDPSFEYTITGCIGMCHLEPIVDVYDDAGELHRFVKVKPEEVAGILENYKEEQKIHISEEDEQILDKQPRVVLRNCGVINPENIDEYIAIGGYQAIEKCVKQMSREEVIEQIKRSGLRGRG